MSLEKMSSTPTNVAVKQRRGMSKNFKIIGLFVEFVEELEEMFPDYKSISTYGKLLKKIELSNKTAINLQLTILKKFCNTYRQSLITKSLPVKANIVYTAKTKNIKLVIPIGKICEISQDEDRDVVYDYLISIYMYIFPNDIEMMGVFKSKDKEGDDDTDDTDDFLSELMNKAATMSKKIGEEHPELEDADAQTSAQVLLSSDIFKTLIDDIGQSARNKKINPQKLLCTMLPKLGGASMLGDVLGNMTGGGINEKEFDDPPPNPLLAIDE